LSEEIEELKKKIKNLEDEVKDIRSKCVVKEPEVTVSYEEPETEEVETEETEEVEEPEPETTSQTEAPAGDTE